MKLLVRIGILTPMRSVIDMYNRKVTFNANEVNFYQPNLLIFSEIHSLEEIIVDKQAPDRLFRNLNKEEKV